MANPLMAPAQDIAQDSAQKFDYGTLTIWHLGKISNSTHLLNADFKLNKGWKIYWHSGGATALPPSVELDAQSKKHVEHIGILWAYPKEIIFLGIPSLGYQGDITLPIEVNLNENGKNQESLTISGILRYPVCAQICIPAEQEFSIPLSNNVDGDRLKKAVENIPVRLNAIDNSQLFWSESTNNNEIILHGALLPNKSALGEFDLNRLKKVIISHRAPDKYRGSYLLPQLQKDNNKYWQFSGQNQLHIRQENIIANAPMPLMLTAEFQGQYIETNIVAQYSDTPPITGFAPSNDNLRGIMSIWALGLLALLAGLLLNLMPCVLPVLSLKLLPITKTTSNDVATFRQNALLSALGMMIGFQLLALLLWGIRLSGFVSWGAQFQSPVFLIAMVWALLLFIAIEMGWQQFRLPLTNYIGNAGNAGSTGKKHDILHKLTTGIVIAWLASSCTAPIIGTIIGTAIAGGTLQLFLVLGLLSLGMASPYLLLALHPRSIRLLPKSGKWNIWLKYGVGIALALTALWLMWLLSHHLSALQKIGLYAICTLLLIASYFKYRGIALLQKLPLFTIAIPLLLLAVLISPKQTDITSIEDNNNVLASVAFAPETIPALLADDKKVIVDITANWCLTCKINDLRVWRSAGGQQLLNNDDVIFMRGNWTLPNDTIAIFLKSYQHYALPFTIIYTPQNPQGVILSELYQLSQVKDALNIN